MNTRIILSTCVLALAVGCATERQDTDQASRDNESNDARVRDAVVAMTPERNQVLVETEEIVVADASAEPKPAGGQRADQSIIVTANRARHERRLAEGDAAESFSLHKGPATAGMVAAQVQAHIRHPSERLYREQYQRPDDHRVMRVAENPVSTFSIDVDTGAYSNMRRWLNQGQLPPGDAVRVEEFINYFDYAYPGPDNPGQPFLVNTEIAPTPWNPETHLLRIGIQGFDVPDRDMPDSNLVFLVDVSGSMRSDDKLPLLKRALGMLVNELDASDSISLVVYAGASGVVLEPTAGDRKATIHAALDRLEAGGSTNGASGIRLAYQMARQNLRPEGVNRVILATDGDFNVGLASTDELIDLIRRQREAGIALTTLGFGTGNYNDHLLERLADEGNGNYAYIDRLSEARKVLAEELTATLMTIASDVKIQLEFNPGNVSEYRLIGYENRALNEEDFANDRVDAGEIGAGHRVTALYEVSLADSAYRRLPDRRYGSATDTMAHEGRRSYSGELAHLRIRYKLPGESSSKLIESPVMRASIVADLDAASADFRFAAAVAAFGQKLRGGEYLVSWGYPEITGLARSSRGPDPFGYRGEFLQLVALADSLDRGESVAFD